MATGEVISAHHDDIPHALAVLEHAPVIVGHNIIGFDIIALQKVFPHWKPKGRIFDTLNASRLIWPELRDDDFAAARAAQRQCKSWPLPAALYGSHKLEAWGYRLGVYKGEFGKTTDWSVWTPEMQEYCEQDVEVTEALFRYILTKGYSKEALALEMAFQKCIAEQEIFGFPFDTAKAEALYADLMAQRAELDMELREIFPDKIEHESFTPKRSNKRYGYIEGKTITKTRIIAFNPKSNQHIADRLMEKYGWIPEQLTPTEDPMVDEGVLKSLQYPEAKLLVKYRELQKIIAMLAEGPTGWLKLVTPEGRIHGRVITNGTVSGRCSHSKPNLGQVPKKGDLGQRCRELFHAPKEWVMVGADASGLELRVFGHFLARYDGGRYAKEVIQGDVHTLNQKAAGLLTRDDAKTFIYAFLYGAGPVLLGAFIVPDGTPEQKKKAGLKLIGRFLSRTPAIKKLKEALSAILSTRKHLKGMEGRLLKVRSKHSALNLIFQSAGALMVKLATVLWHEKLAAEHGLVHGVDYKQVVHVHDEVQAVCKPEYAELVGKTFVEAIEAAGKHFAFRVAMTGEYKIGNNWKETH